MPTKLAELKKPSVEESKPGRKLFCVPLLFSMKDSPKEYVEMFNRYWDQVEEHEKNLEKIGVPTKICYEMIASSGKEGMQAIKLQNERAHKFVKSKIDQGATLVPLEDEKLLSEYLDWSMCLSFVRSPNVVKKILEFYKDAEQKRDEKISEQINKTLEEDKAAILLMRDESRIRIQPRFSPDINVFLIRPPVLNEIHNWLRNSLAKTVEKAKKK